jgi:hypothetical protein
VRYLIVLLLVGCAPMSGESLKQGATDEDMQRDYVECRNENPLGWLFITGLPSHNIKVADCMKARGWTSVDFGASGSK